jgi:hypothetical protein
MGFLFTKKDKHIKTKNMTEENTPFDSPAKEPKKSGGKGKIVIALVVVAAIVGGVLYLSGDGGLFQGKMKYNNVKTGINSCTTKNGCYTCYDYQGEEVSSVCKEEEENLNRAMTPEELIFAGNDPEEEAEEEVEEEVEEKPEESSSSSSSSSSNAEENEEAEEEEENEQNEPEQDEMGGADEPEDDDGTYFEAGDAPEPAGGDFVPEEDPGEYPAEEEEDNEHPYLDIPEGHYATDAIVFLYEQGIFTDPQNSDFYGENGVAKVELTYYLIRSTFDQVDIDEASLDLEISDISEDDYYYDEVMVSVFTGIMNLHNGGTFRPFSETTRDMAIEAVANAAGNTTEWAEDLLNIPDEHEEITRYDLAVILYTAWDHIHGEDIEEEEEELVFHPNYLFTPCGENLWGINFDEVEDCYEDLGEVSFDMAYDAPFIEAGDNSVEILELEIQAGDEALAVETLTFLVEADDDQVDVNDIIENATLILDSGEVVASAELDANGLLRFEIEDPIYMERHDTYDYILEIDVKDDAPEGDIYFGLYVNTSDADIDLLLNYDVIDSPYHEPLDAHNNGLNLPPNIVIEEDAVWYWGPQESPEDIIWLRTNPIYVEQPLE